MRKGRDGGTGEKMGGGREKTEKKEKTDENSGHYVVASSRPPEHRPLEHRTLAPKESLPCPAKLHYACPIGWVNQTFKTTCSIALWYISVGFLLFSSKMKHTPSLKT